MSSPSSHCVPAGGVPRKGLDAYELRRIQQLVMRQRWLAGRPGGPRLRTRGGRVEGRRPLRETLVGTLRQQEGSPRKSRVQLDHAGPEQREAGAGFAEEVFLVVLVKGCRETKTSTDPALLPTLPRPDFLPLLRMKACTANRYYTIGKFYPPGTQERNDINPHF